MHLNLAHRSVDSLKIVSAHLEGTRCEAPFFPLIVAGPHDESQMIHFGVRPIVAKEGRELRRRVVLVDQFGHKHSTQLVTFLPPPAHPTPSASINCLLCHKPIAAEDLYQGAAIPAHKNCIR
jgi:pimeloyl-ACP methyl ester carboxylesterase